MASLLPFTRSQDKSSENPEPSSSEDLKSWFGDTSDDPCIPSLTRKQRLMLFMCFLVCAAVCLVLSLMYIPKIYIKARKFSMLFTFGSLMVIGSISMLQGPAAYARTLFTRERAPFSAFYLGTMVATLYGALVIRSTVFTLFFAGLQIFALFSSLLTYIPGGATGLKMLFTLWWKSVKNIVVPVAKNCMPQVCQV
eukprot:m.4722 g.4722  ORF g.4722 m.4722 type:complete len:195 (-) comp2449_c0_seq1:311-895(-)